MRVQQLRLISRSQMLQENQQVENYGHSWSRSWCIRTSLPAVSLSIRQISLCSQLTRQEVTVDSTPVMGFIFHYSYILHSMTFRAIDWACREMIKVRGKDDDMKQRWCYRSNWPSIDLPQVSSWPFSVQLNVNDTGLSVMCSMQMKNVFMTHKQTNFSISIATLHVWIKKTHLYAWKQ